MSDRDEAGDMPPGLELPGGVTRIVVIGPESTGKTELAEWLGRTLGLPWSPEYAREYAERQGGGGALGAADVVPIALGQLAAENVAIAQARALARPVALHDTDLLSTRVYATAYYGEGAVPAWLRRASVQRRADLYLFCDIDVAWTADVARDPGADRARMREHFAVALHTHGAHVVNIRGRRGERQEQALAAINAVAGA